MAVKNFTDEYVSINGIQQYFLHIPNTSKEVVIMLHGGPGIPNSYLAYYHQPYLGFCNTVYYDQRGAGKTLLKNNIPPESLSYEILVEDLKQTIQYVIEKYQTDRIFLLGHSCGSLLGTKYVAKYPYDVAGYIGYGQIVAQAVYERVWYEYLKEVVMKAGNKRDIKRISAVDANFPNIGREKYLDTYHLLSGLELKYGYKSNDWMKLYRKSPIMSLFRDGRVMMDAEKFNRNLMSETYDFDIRDIKDYEVPIFYVLGRHDVWTPSIAAAEYFETINAPEKRLYWIEDAGHMTDTDNPSAFFGAIKEIVTQL